MTKIIRKVGLEGVRFISPIGFFAEERMLRNEFMVDIWVSFEIKEPTDTDNLENTVDYSRLFDICDHCFKQESKLLENVAHIILNRVFDEYPFIKDFHIKIRKQNPPIRAEIQHSFVELNYIKE